VSIRFVSIRFVSIRFVSIRFVSIRFVSIRFVSIRFVSIRFVSIRFVSIRFVKLPLRCLILPLAVSVEYPYVTKLLVWFLANVSVPFLNACLNVGNTVVT
jgi:hypothetical protein